MCIRDRAYEIEDSWNFDFTLNWQDTKRIPNTSKDINRPEEFVLADRSPSFFLANAQVSKHFKNMELYLGAENLFNFMQDDPIISADNPFGQYFDGSLVWGPVFGRNVYLGVRWRVE